MVQDLQALVNLPGGVDFLEGRAGALTREGRGQLLLIPVGRAGLQGQG